jgi:hypothetical protein
LKSEWFFYESLSEKDRRRYAAMEAAKLGRGGATYAYRYSPRYMASAAPWFGKSGFAVLLDKQAKRLHFLLGPTTFA